MGLEVMDELRAKLADACNRFVRDGQPSTIKHKLVDRRHGAATIVISLCVAEGTQSGVTLQQV